MKKEGRNKLIISFLLIITGLVVYIYFFSNKEDEISYRLSKDVVNIYVGESERLFILPYDSVYDELLWKSENDLIATVMNGVVKGNKVGNTIIDLYSNGEIIDRCIVRVSEKGTDTIVTPNPPIEDLNGENPIQEDQQEEPPIVNYTVKYYDVTMVETGLIGATLYATQSVPISSSNSLSLTPNTLYVVSFDYKTVRGINKFNVDLYPDDLPEKILTATTTSQHFNWEVSSNSNNIKNSKLRFFDNQQEANEKDIIISNITMGTIRCDTIKPGDIIGSMPIPKRVGYNFLGWYTSPTGGTKVMPSTEVNSDMILFPHWEEKIRIITNDFVIPREYSLVSNAVYNSDTLKYKTIKSNENNRYYSLIYVKDANRQINSANNFLKGGQRQFLLNEEINSQNLKSKGMIATNGSFTINSRSNTPVIATKGNITINNKYSTRYVYGTLTIDSSGMLNHYVTKDTTILSDWLRGIGARNTWAVSHYVTSFKNEATDQEMRTAICQIDKHNFVLYSGYSSSIGNYMKELHDVFGCKRVANLDGGGSSGMYYKTKGMSKVGVIYEYSRASDTARVIGDMLYFTE